MTELNRHGTRFLESEAILAAQEQDTEYLDLVLDGMTEAELWHLAEGAERLMSQAKYRLEIL